MGITGSIFEPQPCDFNHSFLSSTWYIIVHKSNFVYKVGDTLEKKKQFFSNFSFLLQIQKIDENII